MNVTFAICLVLFFSFFAESLTWITRKERIGIFIYVAIIRILIILLAICCINKYHNEYEDNLFNYEVFKHQNNLIKYQRTMIYDLSNHLWEEHYCDILQYDGYIKDSIDYEEQHIDSLYNTKL